MNMILEATDLCKTYIVNKVQNNVLCNVNLQLEEGEFVSVMGPSGSGKSTLLYTVSGMDGMTAGDVKLESVSLKNMKEKELSNLRLAKMGFIFQQMYMMKNLCIQDNIILPGYEAKRESREVINERARKLMRELEVSDCAKNDITEVSGGQLQRACICRALINQPKILFADEPTGALNSKAADQVMRQLVHANQNGTTILMVTHSSRVAACSDKVIYLVDGGVRGVSTLGKLKEESELKYREKALQNWLMEQGW